MNITILFYTCRYHILVFILYITYICIYIYSVECICICNNMFATNVHRSKGSLSILEKGLGGEGVGRTIIYMHTSMLEN